LIDPTKFLEGIEDAQYTVSQKTHQL